MRIQPPRGFVPLDLRELWDYRELLYFLAWRDVSVRYRQTVLGITWAILQPLFTMLVFTLIFGRLAGMPSDGLPYPLFAYCGLLTWQLFSSALSQVANSLVNEQRLITKVYFPRLIIPASAVLPSIVDFVMASAVLVILMVYYGVSPRPTAFLFPLFILLSMLSALAVGLWLAALNVRYRDFRYTVPFLIQIWMFITPVVYPASLVPERYRTVLGLNPMAGAVEGLRWAVLGSGETPGAVIWVSTATMLALLLGGLFYFRRMESGFADVV